ncbi:MAG: hypothetical protein R3349_03515, partial [Geminicoccaceae bacterium]|nr:hypothetical protein [Geminicoccaceae bacterium]
DLRSVLVVTDSGESVRAFPVDLTGNRRVRRQPSPADPPPTQPPLQSLDQLANDMEPPEDNDDDDQKEEDTCVC